ncbi:hypothetical protein A4X13_0g5093 [Tilletia indica]|uniref:Uncharacterized protein n=1 Tax=Tilletia indica TaxID=43049 RepID=A0A177T8F5_9BASI|nr:hypothetical protein A4X13_0g5093 [Tilletia indica]
MFCASLIVAGVEIQESRDNTKLDIPAGTVQRRIVCDAMRPVHQVGTRTPHSILIQSVCMGGPVAIASGRAWSHRKGDSQVNVLNFPTPGSSLNTDHDSMNQIESRSTRVLGRGYRREARGTRCSSWSLSVDSVYLALNHLMIRNTPAPIIANTIRQHQHTGYNLHQ